MKFQDILFVLLLCGLVFSQRKAQTLIFVGILLLLTSMLLYTQWIFFTAERCVWYGLCLIFIGMLRQLFQKRYTSHSW